MVEFRVSTLAEAYKQSIQYIIWPQNHRELITEDNERVWRSKQTISIHVEQPYKELSTLIDYYPMGKQGMQKYVDEVMGVDDRVTKNTSNDFAYTYHDRLCHYDVMLNIPKTAHDGITRWYTRGFDIDQIDEIVSKIKTSPDTRRGVAITWKPYEDNNINATSPPCLQWLKCDVIDNHLNMYTVWRSRDILLGMGANIYALHQLHKKIAERTGYKIGFYEDVNFDAHIYYESQGNYLKRWLK
jgi:thymidylate synthase